VGIAAAVITGITSGNLGLALRAGFIAAATAYAFTAVGDMTGTFSGASNGGHAPLDFASEAHLFNMAAHALVGCASAAANRGRCGSGALSGAIGSFAGPLLTGLSFESKLISTSVLGGLASVAGGGKFANGAITAAFGYLFNEAGKGPNDRHQQGVDAVRDQLKAMGYDVSPGPEAVTGAFAEVRVYDLIATDDAGNAIGIEVKTTVASRIFLDWDQVDKDVIVARSGGVTTSGQIVSSVSYYTYCFNCNPVWMDIQSASMYVQLIFAGIPVIPGKLGK
jgi:hypothetical protein